MHYLEDAYLPFLTALEGSQRRVEKKSFGSFLPFLTSLQMISGNLYFFFLNCISNEVVVLLLLLLLLLLLSLKYKYSSLCRF
jgi:hypothetical protein